jgi:hypothetical protein
MRAHQARLEPLNELAKAYLAEADAEEDQHAAERLRRHAQFAQRFVSLTKNEILALNRELERTELELRVAEARSRGESYVPTSQRSAPSGAAAPVTSGLRPEMARRAGRRTRSMNGLR